MATNKYSGTYKFVLQTSYHKTDGGGESMQNYLYEETIKSLYVIVVKKAKLRNKF